jgi:hypothetical protein
MGHESIRLVNKVSDIFPGGELPGKPCCLTDICSHADDTSSETDHSTFAARATSTGPKRVPGVDSPSNHVVDGLAYHERLRHAGFDIEYSASFTEQMRKNGVFGVVFTEPSDVSHVGFVALCERDQ